MNTKLIVGVVLILCLPFFVIGTYLYSFFLPREYYSKVIMEWMSDGSGVQNFDNEKLQRFPDSYFGPGFFQILQSKEVIYRVIDELKLVDKWSTEDQKLPKPQVHFKILKMMNLKWVRGTKLVEIGIYSTDPVEAANIANTIAIEYQKQRIKDRQQMIDRGVAEFAEEVKKQELEAEKARETMAKIRERDHVVDAGENDSVLEKQSADYVVAKGKWLEQKKILETSEQQLATDKMQAKLSFTPVKIWEKAEPSIVPAHPNVPLIMLIGSGIGFLLAIIGGVFVLLGLRQQKA
jgi:capsular polysaccharide biosynthesis protein